MVNGNCELGILTNSGYCGFVNVSVKRVAAHRIAHMQVKSRGTTLDTGRCFGCEFLWPLSGLVTREINGAKVILPIWHKIEAEGVRRASPVLEERYATSSSKSLETVIEDLMQAIAPRAVTAGSGTAPDADPGTR